MTPRRLVVISADQRIKRLAFSSQNPGNEFPVSGPTAFGRGILAQRLVHWVDARGLAAPWLHSQDTTGGASLGISQGEGKNSEARQISQDSHPNRATQILTGIALMTKKHLHCSTQLPGEHGGSSDVDPCARI